MSVFKIWSVVGLAGIVFAITGCSGRGPGVPLAPVSGSVTLNGEPLPNAIVEFNPKEPLSLADKSKSGGGGSMAVTDADGAYVLRFDKRFEGAIVGEHLVRVRPLPSDSDEQLDRKTEKQRKAEIMQIMSTQLVYEVQPGQNSYDIDLKTR